MWLKRLAEESPGLHLPYFLISRQRVRQRLPRWTFDHLSFLALVFCFPCDQTRRRGAEKKEGGKNCMEPSALARPSPSPLLFFPPCWMAQSQEDAEDAAQALAPSQSERDPVPHCPLD